MAGLIHLVLELFQRIFNMRPRVRKLNGCLVADTGVRCAVLTLGLKLRRVLVDPTQRAVRIRARYFWVVPIVRRIPFDAVKEVIYDYHDVSPFGSISLSGYQETDMFAVRLRLVNGEEVLLCRFFGSGNFVNDTVWPDWFYWTEVQFSRISAGSQEDESRMYAIAVAGLIGVEIENQ